MKQQGLYIEFQNYNEWPGSIQIAMGPDHAISAISYNNLLFLVHKRGNEGTFSKKIRMKWNL